MMDKHPKAGGGLSAPKHSAQAPPRLPAVAGGGGGGGRVADFILVTTVLALLWAIVLPGMERFCGGGTKAKDDEVKQNLHAIQLALERYATDNDGNYPFFLYGGSSQINIGVMSYFNPSGRANGVTWLYPVHIPFDMFWLETNTWDYNDTTWQTIANQPEELPDTFGDALAYGGYMPTYPRNPFLRGARAEFFGLQALNSTGPWFAGYGGRDGGAMWDLSLGVSELPQYQCYINEVDGSLAFPGSFYYHARFADGVTSSGHFRYQAGFNPEGRSYNPGSWMPSAPQGPPLSDCLDVSSLDVAGYDLAAVGSPETEGMDIDTSVAATGQVKSYWRTGYFILGGERNPWVREGDYPGVPDYGERPYSDGVPDYFIIHLTDDRI